MSIVLCGNASDSIYLTFKGGCRLPMEIEDTYRCTGCGGRFHKDCILQHFELETEHDWGRQQEREAMRAVIDDARANLTNEDDVRPYLETLLDSLEIAMGFNDDETDEQGGSVQ